MAKFLKMGDVELRPLEPEDFNVIYRWESEIEAWISGSSSAPYSRYGLCTYLQNYNSDIYATREVRMMVLLAGEPVGVVDVFNFDAINSRAEVGVYVDSAHRGMGVGETAIRIAVEKYAFGRLNLHQVHCTVRVSNTSALAMFHSAGFSGEVLLKDWLSAGNGKFDDAVVLHRFSAD
ncbi:MAG: GNAT family N-acetyltransferase [Muribaculaceae bacterium]